MQGSFATHPSDEDLSPGTPDTLRMTTFFCNASPSASFLSFCKNSGRDDNIVLV